MSDDPAKRARFLARHRELAKDDERPVRGSREMVEIAGYCRNMTESAYLWFDGTREKWIPRSLCTLTETGVSMPEWKAKECGFI